MVKQVLSAFRIILIALYTVLGALIGFLLLPLGQQRAIYYASQLWSTAILTSCGIRLTVEGLEHIDATKPCIFIANHQSHMDIPVVFKALPVPLFFIAKKELKRVPFMGWYMTAVGMIFIDRKNREAAFDNLRKAGKEVVNGKNVFSFPEGTRSKTGKLGLFKRGTFVLAKSNDITLVPVGISGASAIIPAGKYEVNAGEVIIQIGQPITPSHYANLSVEELAQHARDTIKALTNEEV